MPCAFEKDDVRISFLFNVYDYLNVMTHRNLWFWFHLVLFFKLVLLDVSVVHKYVILIEKYVNFKLR